MSLLLVMESWHLILHMSLEMDQGQIKPVGWDQCFKFPSLLCHCWLCSRSVIQTLYTISHQTIHKNHLSLSQKVLVHSKWRENLEGLID